MSGSPEAWDRLSARSPLTPEGDEPSLIALVATAWGDLASMLGVCTAALMALTANGHRAALPAFPWSLALAAAWWAAAAAALVTIRRGTPGMLLAGLAFDHSLRPRRLVPVLLAALLQACTLGLPALAGARRSPLGFASGTRLRSRGESEEE